MTYETCGQVFTDKARAIRYARNIANASGHRVWVFESDSQLPVSFASPVPVIGSENERKDETNHA
jgi:hypothetical protein